MDNATAADIRRARRAIVGFLPNRSCHFAGPAFVSELSDFLLTVRPRVVSDLDGATAMCLFFFPFRRSVRNAAALTAFTTLEYWDNHIWMLDNLNGLNRVSRADMMTAVKQRRGTEDELGRSFEFGTEYKNVWKLRRGSEAFYFYELMMDKEHARDPSLVAVVIGHPFGFDTSGLAAVEDAARAPSDDGATADGADDEKSYDSDEGAQAAPSAGSEIDEDDAEASAEVAGDNDDGDKSYDSDECISDYESDEADKYTVEDGSSMDAERIAFDEDFRTEDDDDTMSVTTDGTRSLVGYSDDYSEDDDSEYDSDDQYKNPPPPKWAMHVVFNLGPEPTDEVELLGFRLLVGVVEEDDRLAQRLATLPPETDKKVFIQEYKLTHRMKHWRPEVLLAWRKENWRLWSLEKAHAAAADLRRRQAIMIHCFSVERVWAIRQWEARFPHHTIVDVINRGMMLPTNFLGGMLERIALEAFPRFNDYPHDVRRDVMLVHGGLALYLIEDLLHATGLLYHQQAFPPGSGHSKDGIRGCGILNREVTEVWQLGVFQQCYTMCKREAYEKHFGVEPPEEYE